MRSHASLTLLDPGAIDTAARPHVIQVAWDRPWRDRFEVVRSTTNERIGAYARGEREMPGPKPGRTRTGAAALSSREREVLVLLARGLQDKEIARHLSISYHTVKRHVTNIFGKLELPNRAAASAYAVRQGIADG